VLVVKTHGKKQLTRPGKRGTDYTEGAQALAKEDMINKSHNEHTTL